MITYPLNNIDYTAEDAELYFSTRESGVYDGNDFEVTVSGIDNDVIVGIGTAWIHNTKFSGKVVALKEPKTLTLTLPNSVYDRIDAIVVQFDANKNATEIIVKEGIASSAPIAPTVVRTESLYELHIFHVQRKAGATVISVENLVDLRNNSDYCGIMFDPISSIDQTLTKSGYAADSKVVGDQLLNLASNKILWSGSLWMSAYQTATFTEKVSKQANGLVFVFSPYKDGVAANTDWNCFFVPKWLIVNHSKTGVNFTMQLTPFESVGSKYIYITDSSALGYNANEQAGSSNGITFNNAAWVLRYVIGV